MVKQIRNIITEEEKDRIKNLYGVSSKKRNYIFELCDTIDNRYFIIHDEVFDIQEQKLLGNIWSSMDIFKTIFKNTIVEDNEYNIIKEGICSLPLLESQTNLYGLRDLLLEWNFFDDTWLGRQFKSAGQNTADFLKTSLDGLKKMGIAISQADWQNIWGLLGKGVLYVIRKLKDAMYSNLGMIVDAILVATGIGKSVQWIPWALIVMLDIYQLSSGNFPPEDENKSTAIKWFEFAGDLLGLLFSGAAAIEFKTEINIFKTAGKFTNETAIKIINKNPKIKNGLEYVVNNGQKAIEKISQANQIMKNKFPAGSNFFGGILSGVGNFISKIINFIKKLISGSWGAVKKITGGSGKLGKGVRTGIGVGGLTYALDPNKHGNNDIKILTNKLSDPNTMVDGVNY